MSQGGTNPPAKQVEAEDFSPASRLAAEAASPEERANLLRGTALAASDDIVGAYVDGANVLIISRMTGGITADLFAFAGEGEPTRWTMSGDLDVSGLNRPNGSAEEAEAARTLIINYLTAINDEAPTEKRQGFLASGFEHSRAGETTRAEDTPVTYSLLVSIAEPGFVATLSQVFPKDGGPPTLELDIFEIASGMISGQRTLATSVEAGK